jgi:hypothetical protein
MMNDYSNLSEFTYLSRNRIATIDHGPPSLDCPDPCLDDVEGSGRQNPYHCTLEEVAKELGVSRERARMIEQRALRKCRAFCQARGLCLDDLLPMRNDRMTIQ